MTALITTIYRNVLRSLIPPPNGVVNARTHPAQPPARGRTDEHDNQVPWDAQIQITRSNKILRLA